MSPSVNEYRLGGDLEIGPDGKTARHIYIVTGLTSSPAAHFFDAVKQSPIPRRGQPHPSEPGLFCYRLRARLGSTNDKNDTVVEALFGPEERLTQGAGEEVGSVRQSLRAELVTEETVRDINGALMQTTYISRLSLTGSGSSITIETITHRVAVQRPTFSLVFSRIEASLPISRAFAFSGRTNAQSYRGKPRDAWLCNVESEDRGDGTFNTTYTLTLNESRQGWQALIRHSENGRVPNDLRTGQGEEIRQVYPRANLSGLPI